ncbi:MAG: S-layer homology domain-containing protein [bacterium]|nr:S-layer homology domain-containing protein [bacterium]
MKRTVSIFAAITAAALMSVQVYADSELDEAAAFVRNAVTEPSVGMIGGEWAVLGLARSGADITDKYFDDYYSRVVSFTEERGGVLDDRKYTEYSRTAIAVTAIGRDPRNVGGYNLLLPLADFNKTVWQGLNGSVFALIAFDCGDYEIPINPDAEVQATREMYINEILSHQNEDGGFSLADGGEAEVDITAMALTALSEYTSVSQVSEAVERSVNYLSSQQLESGGFSSAGSENLESAVQVMVAMTSLGISDSDERFVKNGKGVYDNILSYKGRDGFSHERNGGVNEMSNEQALYALAAHDRAARGKNRLYDMSDVVKSEENSENAENSEKLPVVNGDVSFEDVDEAHGKKEVEELAKYGVINGKAENVFAPEDSMTRAEFAAIVVRGLGYGAEDADQSRTERFDDVRSSDWFAGYVGLAERCGIINGISETEFNPNGTITREQAAVMVSRAMMVGGIGNTGISGEAEIRDMLSQFGDYTGISDWAREALTVCYRENILSQSDTAIEPQRPIMRYEVAEMIYNMAVKGKLI